MSHKGGSYLMEKPKIRFHKLELERCKPSHQLLRAPESPGQMLATAIASDSVLLHTKLSSCNPNGTIPMINMTMDINRMDGSDNAWDVRREETAEGGLSNPDLKKKRTWKKPKDKPMRPLSAYNMFFQNQRERIIAGKTEDATPEEIEASVTKLLTSKTRGPKRRQDRISHGQISFGDLARTIATKWKAIDPNIKAIYNKYAGQEKIRYKKEVVLWKEKKEKEHDAKMLARHNSLLKSSTSLSDSVRSLVSSSSSLPASMTSSYNPSESLNSSSLNISSLEGDRLTQENMILRQQDILRRQMGFIDGKPHARVGGMGNDSVARQIPNPGGNSFQFSRRSGNDMVRGTPIASMENDGSGDKFSQFASNMPMLDGLSGSQQLLQQSLQRQLQQEQEHQLLLQLQEQQLRQLQRQLQQTRRERNEMVNMDLTNFPGAQSLSLSRDQSKFDQFSDLERVTEKLDFLKQQRLQQMMRDQNQSSGLQIEDVMMPSNGPHSTGLSSSTSRAGFSIGRPDRSGVDNLQRAHSSMLNSNQDMNQKTLLGRGHVSCPSRIQPGRTSDLGTMHNLQLGAGQTTGVNDNFGTAWAGAKYGLDEQWGQQTLGREQLSHNKTDSLVGFSQSHGTHGNDSDEDIESIFKDLKATPPK